MNDTPTPTNDEWIVTDNENYIEIASIKTCDSIASVHGGKTIGDQYDLAVRIAKVPQLERELTAAREEIDMMGIRYAAAEMHHANNMQEVTEQREDFKKELEIANLRLKGKHHPDDNGIIADGEIDIKALIESNDTLSKDRERWRKIAIYNGLQSDRLAEALKRITNNNVQDEPHTCYAYEFGRMEGIAKTYKYKKLDK